MGFHGLLRPDFVAMPLVARDKWEAIRVLAARLVEGGAIPPDQFEDVHRALVRREKELSTGMEKGIAIPHAAVDLHGPSLAALGLAPQGIPFESLDGEPARIIVLLVAPRERKLEHLRTLSRVVRILADPTLRRELLEAESREAALALIGAREEALGEEPGPWPGRPSPSS